MNDTPIKDLINRMINAGVLTYHNITARNYPGFDTEIKVLENEIHKGEISLKELVDEKIKATDEQIRKAMDYTLTHKTDQLVVKKERTAFIDQYLAKRRKP